MARGLSVGLIGAGAIAVSEHLPSWQRRGAEVSWVVDACGSRAEEIARRFGVPRWSGDHGPVLEDESVDVVDICAPARLHAELATACLLAGKHVLLEKPFATSLEEGVRLSELAERSGRVLMIAENWPYSDVAGRLQRLLGERAVGEPYLLSLRHESSLYAFEGDLPARLSAEEAVGGYTMTAGIHSLNLSRLLLGEIGELCAFSTETGAGPGPFVERNVVIAGHFEAGPVFNATFTGLSAHLGERRLAFRLFGTQGVVDFDVLSGTVDLTARGERTVVERARASMGYDEEIDHLCSCIEGGAAPRTGATDQLKTLAVVEAVYRSLSSGEVERPAALLEVASGARGGPR